MMKKNTNIYKYRRSIHIKNGKDIPDQLVNLLANEVLFHTVQYNLCFLVLIYHNHLDVQKHLITVMTGRPLRMIELWGKLNSMKSAENRKRTVKTALGDHVVIRSFCIRCLWKMQVWNGHVGVWNANPPAFIYNTFKLKSSEQTVLPCGYWRVTSVCKSKHSWCWNYSSLVTREIYWWWNEPRNNWC